MVRTRRQDYKFLVIEDGPRGLKGELEMTRCRPIGRVWGEWPASKKTPEANPRLRRFYFPSVICPSNVAREAPVVEGMFAGHSRQR